MKTVLLGVLIAVVGAFLVVQTQGSQNKQSAPETKIELRQVHMCCEGCAQEVESILTKVAGVKGVNVDQKTRTARFMVVDTKIAQAALDALASDGFHGESGSKDYVFKDDSGAKAGKVSSLTLTGFHNTCGGCVTAFREAIKGVPGITGDNLKAKVTTCEIRGNFDAAELVQALNKGGFHVKVKN